MTAILGNAGSRNAAGFIRAISEKDKLIYPLVSEAFIPQRYKLLRYTGQEKRELTDTWNEFMHKTFYGRIGESFILSRERTSDH